jgi:signal transduction histidine kinase/ligand-binding sensor domain-containing protein
LVRFDGVRFTVFQRGTTPGLDSNRLAALFEDREGVLWIATEDRGLISFRKGAFKSYTTADGLPPAQAISFTEKKDGTLIVKTRAGIFARQGDRFAPYTIEYDLQPAPGGNHVNSSNSRSFSFFDRNGVHRYEAGGYKTYSVQAGLPDGKLHAVYQDQQETLWISTTDKRLFRLPADAATVEEIKFRGAPPDAVEAVYQEGQGVLWLSSALTGLSRLQDGALTRYGAEQGYAGQRTRRFYQDREGNVWLGTQNKGLYQLSNRTITAYTEQEGLSLNIIYATYEDHQGNIWLGTWGSGLSKFRDGQFTNYPELRPITGARITALFEDHEKSLWVGSNNYGLSRLKAGRWTTFKRKDGLAGDSVFAVLEDRAGALWVGTNGGLNRYQDGVFTVFNTTEGLAHPRVQAILEDHAGTLWLGTLGGVSRFKDGVFANYTEREGLSSNHVRSLYEDADGTLWIGTYDSGLNRLKDGKITRYGTQEGLYNTGVFQILEDARGYFWLSCNRGLYRVSRQELNDYADGKLQTITSISFDKGDGMPSSECNGGFQSAGLKSRNGWLMFPTQGGLAVVNPQTIRASPRPPPAVIEDLILDRKSVPVGPKLEIQPGQQHLEIQYTGLSFIKPQLLRFKYQLAGLDNHWIEAGTRRVAYYPYLPPGAYTFTVVAANSDGVWNEVGTSLQIIVYPPFWRTRWFGALVSLAVLGLIFLAYEYRVLRLKRSQAAQEDFSRRLIESQEQERKRIAAELHDSLGQSLAIIKNRATLSLTSPSDHERALEQMDEISTAAAYAIDEVREIAYNLRPYQLDRLGLTKALEAMLKKTATANGLQLTFELDQIDGLLAQESEINLYRIIQESLSNILKHARATEAQVSIKKGPRELEVTVQDNGQGFNPDALPGREPGAGGFGLIGINERARMLGGRCAIDSAPGRGTSLTIKLDLGKKR